VPCLHVTQSAKQPEANHVFGLQCLKLIMCLGFNASSSWVSCAGSGHIMGLGADDFVPADDSAAQDAQDAAPAAAQGGDGGGRFFALLFEALRPPCAFHG
jgi:hypothetical protein